MSADKDNRNTESGDSLLRHLANGLLAVAVGASVAITGMTHEAPELWPGYNASTEGTYRALEAEKPVNLPTWTPALAAQYPDCRRATLDTLTDRLIVVTSAGETARMSFAEADRRIHNATAADDVWVVGRC